MKKMGFHSGFSMLIPFLFLSVMLFGQSATLPSNGICAHRGAMETHPENTISALKEAVRLGAQMIEFDVRMTKDGRLVIMHDATVDRTTNGSGLVSKLAFDKIRILDAGSWKSKKYTGEKVPTLKEVLQIMPKNIWLNIHLKGNKKLGRETAKLVVSENRIHQAVIACEKKSAKGVQQISSEIKICNMERLSTRVEYINETIEKGFRFLQIKSNRDGENILTDIKKLRKKGVQINYFHSEEEGRVKELLDSGVHFILTNNLVNMLDAFEKYNVIEKGIQQ